jgi:hypothetical protein
MGPTRSLTASATIPWLSRFLILNVEPFCAFGGVLMLLSAPEVYTKTMTRHALTTIEPASEFIYTELLGGWLHSAFTEAVVLRLVDDYRVWRLLCMGMLLSDTAYVHSCAQALGGWGVWLQVGGWSVDDWVVTVTTWPFMIARLLIVGGVGMRAKVE